MNVLEEVKKYKDYAVAMRREFHRHPELSWQETETAARIRRELDEMGIPYEEVVGTGTIATLKGKKDHPVIGLRCDIDALPIKEVKELPYRSENDGVMHACGHDGHTAILLGAAKILNEHKDEIAGKIILFFERAEENGGGMPQMLAYMDKHGITADTCYGTHLFAMLESGKVGLITGGTMSTAMGFNITIHGKGGHGSMPYASIDPIKPLAEILLRVTSLMVNRMDTLEPIVVSPCYFHAGTADNIIPETAEMRGTIRYFKEEALDRTLELVEQISRDIAASYDATATLTYSRGKTIPVDNDAASIAAAREVVENIDGLTAIQALKLMGSDNFADFVHAFPGFYCFMGAGFDGPDGSLPNHHPRFTLDEKAFRLGVEFLTGCAVKFLGE